MVRDPYTLTPLEHAFVVEVTREDSDRPKSLVAAFRRVATAKGQPRTVRNEASRMARRPIVKEAIRAVHETQDAERMRKRRSARATIENALWDEYRAAELPRDRLAALKTLAGMAPPEDIKIDPNKDPDTALGKETILKRIEAIMSTVGGDPLDITPINSSTDTDTDSDFNLENTEETVSTVSTVSKEEGASLVKLTPDDSSLVIIDVDIESTTVDIDVNVDEA